MKFNLNQSDEKMLTSMSGAWLTVFFICACVKLFSVVILQTCIGKFMDVANLTDMMAKGEEYRRRIIGRGKS